MSPSVAGSTLSYTSDFDVYILQNLPSKVDIYNGRRPITSRYSNEGVRANTVYAYTDTST